jgi:hypothetical protein
MDMQSVNWRRAAGVAYDKAHKAVARFKSQ